MKFSRIASSLGVIVLCTSTSVISADWLSLQGTEPLTNEPGGKLWGFVQAEYAQTDGTPIAAGPWAGQTAAFNRIAPSKSTDTFNIRRARLGYRGKINDKINYFFLTEFGNNGITVTDGPQLTDASVTLSYIEGARIRIGQFKVPQSNEALKAAHAANWINFTNATNQLLQERFTDEDGSRPDFANPLNGPVSAFRDIGIQVFNTFTQGQREFTYAVMVGNGNGIARADNNSDKEYYVYLATEQVFGGKRAKRQGFKVYTWYRKGKRSLDFANGISGEQNFDRERYGAGFTYRQNKWRAAGEVIFADGMIFGGTDGAALPGALSNAEDRVASFNYLTDNQAFGWQIEGGYQVTPTLEVNVRYDELHRATSDEAPALERKFTTLSFSAQYQFTKTVKATVNYELRDAEAPNLGPEANPSKILSGMDDRIALQMLVKF